MSPAHIVFTCRSLTKVDQATQKNGERHLRYIIDHAVAYSERKNYVLEGQRCGQGKMYCVALCSLCKA